MDLKDTLERAKTSDSAFREIYDETIDRVFRYVLTRTRDREISKEISQEIYLSFWKSLPKFKYISDAHFYAFLWQVVRRQLIKARLRSSDNISLETIYDIPDEETPKEDYRFLLRALTDLKERERLVIELRYFSNLTFEEVAESLGINEPHAKVLHHRAIAALKEKFSEYE